MSLRFAWARRAVAGTLGGHLSRGIAVAAFALAVAAPVLAMPRIEVVTSPGGVTAWLMSQPEVPVISIGFDFAGGSALDPADKAGLANMVSGLLDEGAGELDSQAFQTRLEDLAISLRFSASADSFDGRMGTLKRHRDEAFRLLGLAVGQPRFDAEPLERIRRQILAGLRRDLEDPDRIAYRRFFETALPDHPYARPSRGTPGSVAAIVSADLRGFVARRLARDNLLIAVVGDIDAATLAPLLDVAFGALPARSEPVAVPEIVMRSARATAVIEKPVPQSSVVFGMPGLKRDDPDWYAAYVMNYVLGGGGLTSRLTDAIREQRGLAYSVYAYLYPLEYTGLYLGGLGTQNARVAESLTVLGQELRRLRDAGISADELADAKTYLNGSFPLRLTSSRGIAGLLLAIQRHKLGRDYFQKRPQYINAVTLEDVHRVARRLIRPEHLLTVVVGQPEGL